MAITSSHPFLSFSSPVFCSIAVRKHAQGLTSRNNMSSYTEVEPLSKDIVSDTLPLVENKRTSALKKMYVLLEAVSDRYEMHRNIGEQRGNWNSLLLNSINMMTLMATVTAALAGASSPDTSEAVAAKVSSAILFSAAAGILMIVNKIQPSQLVEEQRNASRLFKQLECKISTLIATKASSMENDVHEFTRRVLALDRAYHLPLLGAMIEKLLSAFSPAAWCPNDSHNETPDLHYKSPKSLHGYNRNGWSAELEKEMRVVLQVVKRKDKTNYLRLGSIALKLNKTMAVSGPLMTAAAAVALVFGVPTLAVMAGALAAAIKTMEHGGQVGMVAEMYRNCAGFFENLEKTIDGALKEKDPRKRENGELFEMKMAISLGRSLSEKRELATTTKKVDEFVSKLI